MSRTPGMNGIRISARLSTPITVITRMSALAEVENGLFWYQIKPFSTSANADILVMTVMGVLSLALILIPFIPGVRDIPRWLPIYKLIWRDYYRAAAR